MKLNKRTESEAKAFQNGARLALRLCVESLRNRAESWAGPNVLGATQASIDIRAELLNEALAIEHWTVFDTAQTISLVEGSSTPNRAMSFDEKLNKIAPYLEGTYDVHARAEKIITALFGERVRSDTKEPK